MKRISRALPLYVYVLWVFLPPTLIGLGTQSITAFWVFLLIMATSYFLYAKNFYVIYKDTKNLYARNPFNIFGCKYIIPLKKIKNYKFYRSGHRAALWIETYDQQTFCIPCYRLEDKNQN
ncbi:MAG: hypothetical protein NZ519_12450 [Bacteroidia bacterium]|nr:hypothetical protein [Bacteroidia bacterium]MDW8302606.1 hypothetical protein [Bacteroidia bacterium]